jgi:hypothetical protein
MAASVYTYIEKGGNELTTMSLFTYNTITLYVRLNGKAVGPTAFSKTHKGYLNWFIVCWPKSDNLYQSFIYTPTDALVSCL